jgi:peptidoglycan/LPS O-acetylase OafA/YrhL
MTLVYDLLIVCGLFPVLVYLGASAGLSQRLAPLANALGNLSYAIYVLHVPLLAFFMAISSRLLHKTSAEAPPRPGWLFILFVMAAAFLIDRIYDRPARGWLAARLLPRKR